MFEPEKWLQLGIAGAAILALLVVVMLFIRALGTSDKRWAGTVSEIAIRQDVTQKETNTVLRDLASVMNRVEVKIDGKGRAA